ncbi:MAG: hypothetical protein KC535_04250 [Nanoarchaeota archaeon]|nr:hypothetical protein [Nanoarchaeota archaeon]
MHHYITDIHKLFNNIKLKFHQNPLFKFLAVLSIFVIYIGISIKHLGAKDGFLVSLLTWSFFVLCTPIADAGFLLDFPVRLLTGLRMIYSEMIVWSIAITTNLSLFFSHPELYQTTYLLSLFHHILGQPFPFWTIILLSAVGTFLSLIFGDEIIDVSYHEKKKRIHHEKHRHKLRFIIMIVLFIIILAVYDYLLNELGLHIPLF